MPMKILKHRTNGQPKLMAQILANADRWFTDYNKNAEVISCRLCETLCSSMVRYCILFLVLSFSFCIEPVRGDSPPRLGTDSPSLGAAARCYQPYHYQTPQAWNRIRLEVADPVRAIWPLIEQEPRFMYLTGYWKGLIPSPVPENTYLFKGLEDVGSIYELLMRSDAYGYIVYPIWLEEQIKLSEDKNFGKYILSKGFMNTLVTDLIYNVEEHLDYIVYNTDSVPEQATPPRSIWK